MSATRHCIEITRFAKTGGPLTKRISLAPDGTMKSDGSACIMARGYAWRVPLNSLNDLASLFSDLDMHEAIALGALHPSLPDKVAVTTKRKLNGHAGPDVIARTGDHILYHPDQPAFCLIDYDSKAMPTAVRARITELDGVWPALLTVLPELADAAYLIRLSTSSNIFRTDIIAPMPASDGLHIYLLMRYGSDIERFLRVLHQRCWLHGLGWYMVGAAGQMLERSIVDRMVGAPERLVFEAAPDVILPLKQAEREARVRDGDIVDSRAIGRDLGIVERSQLAELKREEASRLEGSARKARADFIADQSARIAMRLRCPLPDAVRTVERQCEGILLPGVVLPFDEEEHHGATVADVLGDPERFLGATLSDPVEGVSYGVTKAMIMQRSDGTMWTNSFAHGRTTYDLKYDAALVEAELRKAGAKKVARAFVRLVLAADIDAEEQLTLRDLACQLSGTKPGALNAMLKGARKEQDWLRTAEARDRQATERTDSRLRLSVPLTDAERLPILTALDKVFLAVDAPEPPMRGLDSWPVEVRVRPPGLLHELTTEGANQEEDAPASRLPPPSMPLLSPHDCYSMAHLVERHIQFVKETKYGDEPVALPPAFVDHYLHYRDSALPMVSAVVTAPLILSDGTLLAPIGLDRDRRLVFRIEAALRALLPDPQTCSLEAGAKALEYLGPVGE